MTKKKPVMLVIMDGFGCSHIEKDNAVAQADRRLRPMRRDTNEEILSKVSARP